MKAEALRRRLTDAELERLAEAVSHEETLSALCAIVDRLADRQLLFEASGRQREEIARLAADRLESGAEDEEDDLLSRLRMAKGEWYEKAEAAQTLSDSGVWSPWRILGRLAPKSRHRQARLARAGLDSAAARALAIGLRDVVVPGASDGYERLSGPAVAALRNERDGADVWDEAARPLLGHFAANGRATGSSRLSAALETLVASAVLKGDTLVPEGESRATAYALGAAVSAISRPSIFEETPEVSALRVLVAGQAEESAVRLSLWEDQEPEVVRLLGAVAARAVFGRGAIDPPSAVSSPNLTTEDGSLVFEDDALTFRLPEAWHERFSHIAAADAAQALEGLTSDPRTSETDRLMAQLLAETLRAQSSPGDVSFSEALGLDPAEFREGAFRVGQEVYRASFRSRRPSTILCYGKRGRLLRCRAVADDQGAVVGYLAFDPLSRELAGRPLYAAYDLDGRRFGYAWPGEDLTRIRAGEPEHGFMTAPEEIPV